MTSWQNQQTRGGGHGAVDASGAPMSRRAAREAERRAAEALAEKQPHPSGVVDFDAHDFSPEFSPDQEFNVGDTQDIWAALTHGQRAEPRQTGDFAAFGSALPAPSAPPRPEASSVSGELLDRVRDAVLRRAPDVQTPPPVTARPATGPQQSVVPQQPAAFSRPPSAPPQRDMPQRGFAQGGFAQGDVAQRSAFPTQSAFETASGLTRRQRREREAAGQREDGLPGELFPDPHAAAAPFQAAPFQAPLEAANQSAGFEGYDYQDDGYYDQPYRPEPTISIPRPALAAEPAPTTNPLRLPSGVSEPVGDDALTFSSPVSIVPADQRDDWASAQADPAFIEPVAPWAATPPAYAPQPYDPQAYEPEAYEPEDYEPQAYEPRPSVSGPIPAQPVMPFVPPRAVPAAQQFQSEQLGPPSEVTDLAGFEALIRKARQQPPAPSPGLAWADEEEVQEGFTGLLSRSVQGSHGSANALILPNDPQPDLTQAVGANGDIFITGSMSLPRSLSTTGGSSALFDSHEIDRLYEASQDEPAAGVAPVRASKAVSGAPHDRSFSSAPRRRGNVLPTVLAVVAGAMAVGVVTLLVGSWVLQLF